MGRVNASHDEKHPNLAPGSEARKLIRRRAIWACCWTYFGSQVGVQQYIAVGIDGKGVAISSELYGKAE